MLTAAHILQALPLAEQFDAKNINLSAIAGTPLDYLNQATGANPSMVLDSNGEAIIDFMAIETASNTKDGIFDVSRHTYTMSEIKAGPIKGVTDTLFISRNRVAPEVKELVDLLSMRLAGANESDLTAVQIAPVEGDAVMYNPALHSLLSKYELQPPVPIKVSMTLPDISIAEIYTLLETGNKSLDDDVAAWAAAQGNQLQSVYREFFIANVDNFGADAVIRRASTFESQVAYWKGSALTVFLIAKHLLTNEKLIDGTDMALADYRKQLTAYVEQAGRILNRQIESQAISIKNNVLVKEICGNVISVNAPVYNSWMENGGDNDILLGMAISNDKNFTVASISAKADQYRNAWRSHVGVITQKDSLRRFNFVRSQLVLCYESMLGKPNEDGNTMPPSDIAALMKRFKSEVDKLALRDLDDLYHTCLKLICDTRYSDSHAYRFLNKMAEVAKASPNLTPREAGTVATIWYIASWVGTMTQVVDC